MTCGYVEKLTEGVTAYGRNLRPSRAGKRSETSGSRGQAKVRAGSPARLESKSIRRRRRKPLPRRRRPEHAAVEAAAVTVGIAHAAGVATVAHVAAFSGVTTVARTRVTGALGSVAGAALEVGGGVRRRPCR